MRPGHMYQPITVELLGKFALKAADDLRKIRLIRTKAGGAEEKDLLACQ